MYIDIPKIKRILEKNEMLQTYINNLSNSINKCSNDAVPEMRLTKGHLDFIYYSEKLIDRDDYNAINDLLGELGITFKRCQCQPIIY